MFGLSKFYGLCLAFGAIGLGIIGGLLFFLPGDRTRKIIRSAPFLIFGLIIVREFLNQYGK